MYDSPLETKEQKENESSLVSNFKGRQLKIMSSICFAVELDFNKKKINFKLKNNLHCNRQFLQCLLDSDFIIAIFLHVHLK